MIKTAKEQLRRHLRISLYSNAYHLMVNQVIGAIGSFIFWIIATRYYSTEALGLAGAITSAISWIASISDFGLSYGVIRFLPNAGHKANRILNTSFTLYLLISILASLIFISSLALWSPGLLFLRSRVLYLVAFVAFTAFAGWYALLQSVFIAYRSSKFISVMSLVVRLVSLPLLILFIFLSNDFAGIVAAQSFATLTCLIVAGLLFMPKVNKGYLPFPQINKTVVNDILPYSIRNSIGVFLGAPTTWLLPVIVLNVLGAEANAYFYIALTVSTVALMGPTAIATSAFAESSHQDEALLANLRRSLKLSIILGLVVVAVIFAFGDKLLLLFGKGYSQSSTTVLWLLSLVVFPLSINNLYIVYARIRNNFRIIIGTNAAVTILVLGLTYFLAPKFGLVGVGIAYLAGYTLVAMGITAMVLWKEPRKKLAIIWGGSV